MNDPVLGQILLTTFKYGVCGSGVAIALRWWTRHQPGPRLEQIAGVGFLIGAGFGALFGIFESLLTRS